MTDSDLILSYLKCNPGWQNSADMQRNIKPGAVGWAMRSRISCDLNKRILPAVGLRIESRKGGNGMAEYRPIPTAGQMELL